MTYKKANTYLNVFMLLFFMAFQGCNEKNKVRKNNDVDFKETKIFELIPHEKSGIKFMNHVEENLKNYVVDFNYVYNGGGVALGDINNDGLSDIYFSGNEVPNKLYLNKGDFKFEDITEFAGVNGGNGWHTGINMVDINHDGYLDIYICRGGFKDTDDERKNLLYVNQGDNTFKEKAEEYGIADIGFSVQAAFFDMDNDNDLDMYLTNRPELFFQTAEEITKGEKENNDLYRDKLYLNENDSFHEISLKAGITKNYGYGLGVAVADVNNDGFTDIYVTNDYEQPDYLYINQGNNTFKESIKKYTNHTSFYSMGVDIADFNNDGFEDILTLDMVSENYVRSKTTMATMDLEGYRYILAKGYHNQYMHNALQLNQGNGFFSEIGQFSGISKTDWSWSCLASDFDNDGYRDIFVSNGYRRDVTNKDATNKFFKYINSKNIQQNSDEQNIKNILNLYDETKLTNYIFKNNADLTFSKKMKDWGLNQKSFSNGAATADLDNDGDLDLVVNNLEDIAFVYENKTDNFNKNYIKIKLEGPEKNTYGIGAKIALKYNNTLQYHDFKTTRGYLSSVEPIAHFGLDSIQKIDEIKIIWPDGKSNSLKNIKGNQLLKIAYSDAKIGVSKKDDNTPLFAEVTNTTIPYSFTHKENVFDDYKEQILLPHKMSSLGPFTTVSDINGDGLEDFFVGGASGQSGRIYLQNNDEKFNFSKSVAFEKDKIHEDMGASFFDIDGDGDKDLYVVSGGSEKPIASEYYQDRLYLNNGKGTFTRDMSIPKITSSGSCVVTHDYDKDGDLDLFVGGRSIPGQYPKAPESYWLKNNNGILEDVTATYAEDLQDIGMVTSATWTDIDGDSIKEFVVVGEWMPITIFKTTPNGLDNVTSSYDLDLTRGWWNKVIASDYDQDGDMDLIVGNLGENYKFKATKEKPFYVFADDFDKNGTNDIFLAKTIKNSIVPIRGKECSSQQIPGLNKKFRTYEGFANADLSTILGEGIVNATRYEANIFSSIFLENQNGKLIIKKLPTEAQFSTVNSILCSDFDADGFKDIIVAGNNFEVEVETTRADASPGFLLKGDKTNSFKALSPKSSGIFVPYNVKDAQEIKLADGAKGILVSTNNGLLRLFKSSISTNDAINL